MNPLTRFNELRRVAQRRSRSQADYLAFQAFQARWLIEYLESQSVALAGQRMLDLGSGVGGYSLEFARCGARVVSVDLVQPRLPADHGRGRLDQIRGNALQVALRDGSVDLVFCASLIEHVRAPHELLVEIRRLLRPGGVAYVSFPPYWSPAGGHEFAPFHYLGQRLAMRLVSRERVVPEWVKAMYGANERADSFDDLYEGWGLFEMTIGKMRRLIPQAGFDLLDMSTRYLPISLIRWPLFNEVLTWHAQFLLKKPE